MNVICSVGRGRGKVLIICVFCGCLAGCFSVLFVFYARVRFVLVVGSFHTKRTKIIEIFYSSENGLSAAAAAETVTVTATATATQRRKNPKK